EFAIICSFLAVHSGEIRLWLRDLLLLEKETDPDRRFRAIFALADYDPDSKGVPQGVINLFHDPDEDLGLPWQQLSSEVANQLVKGNTLDAAKWQHNMLALRYRIGLPLLTILEDRNRFQHERFLAARLLVNSIVRTGAARARLTNVLLDTEGVVYK